jgi:hypothetical protein
MFLMLHNFQLSHVKKLHINLEYFEMVYKFELFFQYLIS